MHGDADEASGIAVAALPGTAAGYGLPHVAGVFIAGVVLGRATGGMAVWFAAGAVAAVMMLWMRYRCSWRGVGAWGMIVVLCLGAAWYTARETHVSRARIAQYLQEEPGIGRVVGKVIDGPRITSPEQGYFGRFTYEPPATQFLLRVESIWIDGRMRPADGTLLGKIERADHTLRPGDRIEAMGWVATFGPTKNPGEWAYAADMRRRGIDGRISLRSGGNWRRIGAQDAMHIPGLDTLRQTLNAAVTRSLAIGLEDDPRTLALLDRLLLGGQRDELGDVEESFRRVGLAHVLSISGAHLAVLLALVWWLARWFGGRPPRVALVVLVVLLLYLCAVPVQVPVIRAAIMAGLFCLSYATGRWLGGIRLLALAAVATLLWRPGDLFTAGYQLSFVTVWALLCFTKPVSRWLVAEPEIDVEGWTWRRRLTRQLADAVAVSLVAFGAAAPIVAYHFEMVSPAGILMSLVMLPVFTATMALGYLKIVLGLALPSASWGLSEPLGGLGRLAVWAVEQADTVPGSSLELARQPSLAWALAVMALGAAVAAGRLAGRRVALVLSLLLITAWTAVEQRGPAVAAVIDDGQRITLHTFAVGDGSCHLVRTEGHTVMFDCGSQNYPLIGRRSIVPALRTLGVRHIDTLVVSHPDMDHFVGTLDLLDVVTVGRVLVPPQLLAEAEAEPTGATAFLVSELTRRGLPPRAVNRGWVERRGQSIWRIHWPEADFTSRRDNNTSITMTVTLGDARLLLCGDIESEAMERLLGSGDDLRAEVMEVPHHGSYTDFSADFLAAVSPKLVLQSSGPKWAARDKWQPVLDRHGVQRLVTDDLGMITLQLNADGAIAWSAHRE